MTTDDQPVEVVLRATEIAMICAALDSYEYWELGDALPRNNGLVFLPGDLIGEDYFWDGRAPTDEEQELIGEVRESRALAARLLELCRAGR